MGRALYDSSPAARDVFAVADEALGLSISSLCFDGPEDDLKLTANTQPAILTVSVAVYRAAIEAGAPELRRGSIRGSPGDVGHECSPDTSAERAPIQRFEVSISGCRR